jgi:hypothetical protein
MYRVRDSCRVRGCRDSTNFVCTSHVADNMEVSSLLIKEGSPNSLNSIISLEWSFTFPVFLVSHLCPISWLHGAPQKLVNKTFCRMFSMDNAILPIHVLKVLLSGFLSEMNL